LPGALDEMLAMLALAMDNQAEALRIMGAAIQAQANATQNLCDAYAQADPPGPPDDSDDIPQAMSNKR